MIVLPVTNKYFRRLPSPRTILFAFFVLVACCSIMGCFLAQVQEEMDESLESAVLVGWISSSFPGQGPIIVAAYTKDKSRREIVHYTVLHESGEYELLAPKGEYYIFAYIDRDRNLTFDPDEPAGQYGDPKMVSAPAGGVLSGLNITLSQAHQQVDIPYGFEIAKEKPNKLYSRQAGALLSLDDELFSAENGRKGYWEPLSFFKEHGGNIYFLEKYDPQKIPILFIHGAGGTPKGWEYFVNNIDRSKYQPWFFYYPSGARIPGMAYLLYWKLESLKIKYDFKQLYITAHSMGGLVARAFLVDHSAHFPYVQLFISLATPWGGDGMAEYGVQQSPGVVPCWIDMQPKSDFLQSIYRKKMPEDIDFYMFFGHKGSRNPFRPNNDNTIALSSLLDRRAQSEAKMNFAFNEDHASIIQSAAVLEQYNAIIDSFAHPVGGFIQIHFSYTDPLPGPKNDPMLVLQPKGKKDSSIKIRVTDGDNGKILGPFPAGDYLATFNDLTAVSTGNVPIRIEQNTTSSLKYVLTPDHVVYGTLISAPQSQNWAAGMPYEQYFPVESITFTSAGLKREVQVLEGEDINLFDYFIQRRDCYYKGNFFFFGLPTGKFELTIRAQGYQTFTRTGSIQEGEQLDPMLLELLPEH